VIPVDQKDISPPAGRLHFFKGPVGPSSSSISTSSSSAAAAFRLALLTVRVAYSIVRCGSTRTAGGGNVEVIYGVCRQLRSRRERQASHKDVDSSAVSHKALAVGGPRQVVGRGRLEDAGYRTRGEDRWRVFLYHRGVLERSTFCVAES